MNREHSFSCAVSSSSPPDEGVGRGPRRGAAPPLPSPLLHPVPVEERECCVFATILRRQKIEHPTSNGKHRTQRDAIPHWELDVGWSMLDVFREFGSGLR